MEEGHVKAIFVVMISLVCLLPLATAQTTRDDEREIRELETQRFQAMERVDVATLNRILSDDLIYTHATGLQQTKAELIGVLGSGDLKYESINPSDVRVRIYGATAVVTGRASIKIKTGGGEQSFKICYLDVYVKQDGRWQMVAWQSSRFAP
jgi:ketosteroid isomerase-like protein